MNLKSLHETAILPKALADYEVFNPSLYQKIKQEAAKLSGLKIMHLNATAQGGGVAPFLEGHIALENDLGFDSRWFVLPPDQAFFEVTKKIHNFLQGKEGDLTDRDKEIYLAYNKKAALSFSELGFMPDVLIIHDPQPLALIGFLDKVPQTTIWRSHIDTSFPNLAVFNFLLPYLKLYRHYIFTLPDYVQESLDKKKVSFIAPAIDPLSPKNKEMDKDFAKEYIETLGIDIKKPFITQVSRLDPWKDPFGVIDAYRLAKHEVPDLQLVLLVQSATDDPEGKILYEKVKKYINDEKGIFLLLNVSDNEKAVNAFQTASDIILQKSLREGFGLTVTEAMWKGAVVIGGNVGGIKAQIKHGENGFLVDTIDQTKDMILYVLKNPRIKEAISQKAREKVKKNYLLTNSLFDHLRLYKGSI